jgi:hypothetical protein
MSALGQKQTFAAQKGMSALPPIATAKADFRTRSCLLYNSMWQSLAGKGHAPKAGPHHANGSVIRWRFADPALAALEG